MSNTDIRHCQVTDTKCNFHAKPKFSLFFFLLFGCSLSIIKAENFRQLKLHKKKIESAYRNGYHYDIQVVLKNALFSSDSVSAKDQIFALKMLSALYAQNPHTFNKARVYMWRVLEMDAEANLPESVTEKRVLSMFTEIRSKFSQGDSSILHISSPNTTLTNVQISEIRQIEGEDFPEFFLSLMAYSGYQNEAVL